MEEPINGAHGTHVQDLDALIVGAGFGGVYQLKIMRDAGYNVKLVEHGTDYGGVWFWNRYPGARVDSGVPHYEFSHPDLSRDWTWKQKFPGGEEIRAYFSYVAEKWDLRKDTQFNTFVSSATWDDAQARWNVETQSGEKYRARYLVLNCGSTTKKYVPAWEGIDSFQGKLLHSLHWPREEPELSGKRIAIIGTGSTGVQLAQELSKVASQLTVFQRTPNMSLPMRQVNYKETGEAPPRNSNIHVHAARLDSFTGLDFNFLARSTFDDNPEQRQATYENLWNKGNFSFWLATYSDMLFSKEANREAYHFWRDKTRARIHDPKVADMLAPMQQPHAFGCKRVSLEHHYFEIYNQPNVSLVDVSDAGTPITQLTQNGVLTTDGHEHEFDIIISATGYDAITGGFTRIHIQGTGTTAGETLRDHWKHGVRTYLGLSAAHFPNLFFTYGPHAPTALCNGPTCAELQGNWILQAMNHMRDKGHARIEPTSQSEEQYKELVLKLANASLLPSVKSPREPLVWLGGVPEYYKMLDKTAAEGYSGFKLS
ncbi:hypothetical protein ACEQ8H_000638 [Pleosporales sp. CAS-2024a]